MINDGHILKVIKDEADDDVMDYGYLYEVICPNTPPVTCGMWLECDCNFDSDYEDLYEEVENDEEAPCPSNPGQYHRANMNSLVIDTYTCFVRNCDFLPDAADELRLPPGKYPVAWEVEDEHYLYLELAQ